MHFVGHISSPQQSEYLKVWLGDKAQRLDSAACAAREELRRMREGFDILTPARSSSASSMAERQVALLSACSTSSAILYASCVTSSNTPTCTAHQPRSPSTSAIPDPTHRHSGRHIPLQMMCWSTKA